MTSDPLGQAGITPYGVRGEPSYLGASGAMTGGSATKTLTNPGPVFLIVVQIDVIELVPGAGDNITLYAPTSTNPVWNTTVGTGHPGAFYDVYRGLMIIGQGQTLTGVMNASGGVWYFTAWGYGVQYLDQYSMS